MKKYMLIALLPVIFQSEIYGTTRNLNSMIETELQVARDSMRLRIDLDLEKIVNELIRYAKVGNVQYNNARTQLAAIKGTLNQKRSEQYDTAWSKFMWAFGKYPDFVVTDIDPAIKMVTEADRSIYITRISQYASDATYVGSRTLAVWLALSAAATVGVLISGGLATSKFDTSERTQTNSTDTSISKPSTTARQSSIPVEDSSNEDPDDEWRNTEYKSNPFK